MVGLYLTCHNLAGGWWGEGDDMIFIDGEKWPPSYHGTGTEEIFGGGACPNLEYAGPYTGFLSIHEQGKATWRGQNSMYRWFVHDPIRFRRSLRWTIEHGHANNFENDYSSVAYWYQTEPHKPFPALPAERLPPGGVPDETPADPRGRRGRGSAGQEPARGRRCVRRPPGDALRQGHARGLFAERRQRLDLLPRAGQASGAVVHQPAISPAPRTWDVTNCWSTADRSARLPTSSMARTGWDRPMSCQRERSCSATSALEAGECELKFQCLGKSDRSTGYFLAIDALMLRPSTMIRCQDRQSLQSAAVQPLKFLDAGQWQH